LQEQVTFRWDDHDDVWFVLDQYAKLNYLSTGLLKQMSMSTRHVAPLGHIILNQSPTSLVILLNAAWLAEKQQIPINSFRFVPTGTQTHIIQVQGIYLRRRH